MKKVELLAPAGSYESFLGAIHAGADAVYLGGTKFGARAYADNFTQEEIGRAARYAHIHGRRVYLTLNTLVKERELDEVYSYLLPLYKEGLDGVIIQDFGIFEAVGQWFPDLERHISTQMAVTGKWGASLLKGLGAVRIVPARELSLAEIKEIKSAVDIEIETFIHGAICYCYSGQCLFSSILGGRSGNRGRCAQPCRLPYKVGEGRAESYPLSLKDMCTLEILPALIEAGIDSFKIEGRMKGPEYAAGVTAIYRKYIDSYYRQPQKEYRVEAEDMEMLRSLYMRSEISEGYYYRQNGKAMVTMDSPSYRGRDAGLAGRLRATYVEGDYRLPIRGRAVLEKGRHASFTIAYNGTEVTALGEVVQEAKKQPLLEEQVVKQLAKSGNTEFVFKELQAELSPDAFMPVKLLNELRRRACEMLGERLMEAHGLAYAHRRERPASGEAAGVSVRDRKEGFRHKPETPRLHMAVMTGEQLRRAEALGDTIDRIYIPSDLCEDMGWRTKAILPADMPAGPDGYLALPPMIRNGDRDFLQRMEALLKGPLFKGVLVRCLEGLGWLKGIGYQGDIVSDANLYIWNRMSLELLSGICGEHYLPYELNLHEIKDLAEGIGGKRLSMVAYGRLPMMITANCVAKTDGCCRRMASGGKGQDGDAFLRLTDRYRKEFPVYLNCKHCYNIIYNSLPLSLHGNMEKISRMGIHALRLDFTTETGEETDRILRFFGEIMALGTGTFPYGDYTKAHFMRGVE